MSVTLAELVESIQRRATTLRGRAIEIRALRDCEAGAILRLFPKPVPPLGDDPNGGSLAPKVENPQDPAYRAKFEAWWQRRARMIVGICAGLQVSDGPRYSPDLTDGELKPLLERLDIEVSRALTAAEVLRLSDEIAGILDESAAVKLRSALIVDSAAVRTDQVSETPPLPSNYFETRTSALLRLCREYGKDPARLDEWDPGLQALLLEDLRIRQAQERRDAGQC